GRSWTRCSSWRSRVSRSSIRRRCARSLDERVSARAILVATRSEGKLRELRPIFAAHGLTVIDLTEAALPETPLEDTVEAFDSFEGNALAKARYFHALSGLPTAADDSGLEVPSLGGLPGVRSKRWSERPDLSGRALDDANNAKLIE